MTSDLFWMAGVFDCKACIYKTAKTIAIDIECSDKDIINPFYVLFGGSMTIRRRTSVSGCPIYKWSVKGSGAHLCIMKLEPLIRSRYKKKRIISALSSSRSSSFKPPVRRIEF